MEQCGWEGQCNLGSQKGPKTGESGSLVKVSRVCVGAVEGGMSLSGRRWSAHGSSRLLLSKSHGGLRLEHFHAEILKEIQFL